MFGKLMSIPDAVMGTYYELLLAEEPPGGPRRRGEAGAGAPPGRPLPRRRGGRRGPRRTSTACTRSARRPRTCPRSTCDQDGVGDGRDVHLPALLAGAFGVSQQRGPAPARSRAGSSSTASRCPASRLDVPAGELDGPVLQVGKRRFARRSPPEPLAAPRTTHACAWLYCSVALASDHERSQPRKRRPQRPAHRPPIIGPLTRGLFCGSTRVIARRRDPSAPQGGL